MARKTLQDGPLTGLGFGAGVHFIGSRYGDDANQLKLSSVTRFDAGVHYDITHWRFSLNAKNLFDRIYVNCQNANYCSYGLRREVLAPCHVSVVMPINRRHANLQRRQLLLALGCLPFASVKAATELRVASLGWAGAQILAALGVPPIALTERGNYFSLAMQPPMPPGIVELGLHRKPNLELLVQMRPHLIGVDTDQASLLPQLERIAPTFTVDIYAPSRGRPYARAIAETLRLASWIDREREARAYLASVEQTLERCARSIHALGPLPPVPITDLCDDGRHLYVYGSNSMMQDILDRLGVPNAWSPPTPSGFALLGIESLATFTTHADVFHRSRASQSRGAAQPRGQQTLESPTRGSEPARLRASGFLYLRSHGLRGAIRH